MIANWGPTHDWFDLNRDSMQATGLVSWWSALASPIGPLRDLNLGYNGTLTGNAFVGTDPEWGLALQCDGNGDYADAGTPPVITGLLTDYTITAWVKPTGSFTNFRNIFGYGNATALQLGIIVVNTGQWSGQLGDGSGVTGGTLTLDRWYHVAYSFQDGPSSGTARSYQDGVFQNTATGSNFTRSGSNFTIGADAFNSRWFRGAIADVRVYNSVVPPTVIHQMWAAETRYDLYDVVDWDALDAFAEAVAPPQPGGADGDGGLLRMLRRRRQMGRGCC